MHTTNSALWNCDSSHFALLIDKGLIVETSDSKFIRSETKGTLYQENSRNIKWLFQKLLKEKEPAGKKWKNVEKSLNGKLKKVLMKLFTFPINMNYFVCISNVWTIWQEKRILGKTKLLKNYLFRGYVSELKLFH